MNNLNEKKKELLKIKRNFIIGLYGLYLTHSALNPVIIDDETVIETSISDEVLPITKLENAIESTNTENVNQITTPIAKNEVIETENKIEEIISKLETEKQNKITYYDFPCPIDLQQHIIDIANSYGYPIEIPFVIIDQESDGNWHLNGYISPTNDYGFTQINKCNMDEIYEATGITQEEILNNPYKAIEAQGWVINTIMNVYDYEDKSDVDYKNVFGTYNGWINWKKKSMAVRYANRCMERLEEKFGITEENIKSKQKVLN